MTGKGYNDHQRNSDESRIRNALLLSHRHRQWGHDCPAVDLDFVLAEYNHGVTVAVVDYKHHRENVDASNERTHQALSGFYDSDGNQLPFFVARFWPETWAFKVHAGNSAACLHLGTSSWVPMTEQRYVRSLYQLRKDALTRGDEMYLARLNTTLPPEGADITAVA